MWVYDVCCALGFVNNSVKISTLPHSEWWKLHVNRSVEVCFCKHLTVIKFLLWLLLDYYCHLSRWHILVWQCSWSVQTLIYLQTGTTVKGGLIQRPSCVWWRLRALYMQFSWRLFNLSGWPFCNSKQSLWSWVAEKAEHSSRAQTQTAPLAGWVSNSLCILLLSLFLLVLMRCPTSLCLHICWCKGMKRWAVSCVLHRQLPSRAIS